MTGFELLLALLRLTHFVFDVLLPFCANVLFESIRDLLSICILLFRLLCFLYYFMLDLYTDFVEINQ